MSTSERSLPKECLWQNPQPLSKSHWNPKTQLTKKNNTQISKPNKNSLKIVIWKLEIIWNLEIENCNFKWKRPKFLHRWEELPTSFQIILKFQNSNHKKQIILKYQNPIEKQFENFNLKIGNYLKFRNWEL